MAANFGHASKAPEHVWNLLLDRGENQIGFQELLGVLLTRGTFSKFLHSAGWISFADDDGVVHSILKGGGGGPEAFECRGRFWHELAEAQCDLHMARVESGSNPADAPTRDKFDALQRMSAKWMPPQLPDWIQTMWQGPILR